jgi:predicted permease
MFLRSLASSRNVDPGFRADGVVDVDIDLGLLGARPHGADAFREILRASSALPGVESASLAAVVPLSGSNMETRVTPEGMVVRGRRDAPMVYFNVVGPRFFATLRTPVLRGREFLDSDGRTSAHVAVLNETAARRLFSTADALGKRFHWGDATGTLYEVVGIARDANYVMPGEAPKPTVYMPFAQNERAEMTLQLRTSADLTSTRRAVWSLLHSVTPMLPPPPVVRMADDMAVTLLPVRAGAVLLGSFGALALVLAAAGIYGVASYSVLSRTREIGIRAALGATRGRLVRMILMESGRRVGLGAVFGFVLAIAAAVGLTHVLFGVQTLDPFVLASVAVTIGVVALLASLGPARRAASADPAAAIRAE